jgi:hypothetical protein
MGKNGGKNENKIDPIYNFIKPIMLSDRKIFILKKASDIINVFFPVFTN